MNDRTPHYLLISETSQADGIGRWRFVLQSIDGSAKIEAADVEPDIWGERLDLLTVVRGLESLDQPSRVTLIGCTRYVEQGIQFGLTEWRDNGWRWEYFGQMAPVRDADLWQRMDHILQFHSVECGQRRFDAGHNSLAGHHCDAAQVGSGSWADRITTADWLKYTVPALAVWCGVLMETALRSWQMGVRMVGAYCSSVLVHRS
jgi:ribonuclease HI